MNDQNIVDANDNIDTDLSEELIELIETLRALNLHNDKLGDNQTGYNNGLDTLRQNSGGELPDLQHRQYQREGTGTEISLT